MIETNRLLLRMWENDDAEMLYEHAKLSVIANMGGWPVHSNTEYSMQVIRDILVPEHAYAIILKENNMLIGNVGFHLQEKSNMCIHADEAEISYWIGAEFWGMGYAPEAVNDIIRYKFISGAFKTIWACYIEGNNRSKRVLEKCGFEYARTEKEKYWSMIDTYHITHIMKISV